MEGCRAGGYCCADVFFNGKIVSFSPTHIYGRTFELRPSFFRTLAKLMRGLELSDEALLNQTEFARTVWPLDQTTFSSWASVQQTVAQKVETVGNFPVKRKGKKKKRRRRCGAKTSPSRTTFHLPHPPEKPVSYLLCIRALKTLT